MSETKTKPKKKKSIFRSELLILLVVVVLLITSYIAFFLDMHLKYILQKSLTKAYGAEVNVGALDLDLRKLNLEIRNVEFTNHEKPMENLFVLGRLAIELVPRELMFFSVVSETSYLDDISVNTPRKSKGYVSPESQRLISYSTDFKGSKEKAFDQKFDGSIFENLYNFSKSKDANAELNKIKDELNLPQLEASYKKQFEEKKKRIENLKTYFDKEKYQNLLAEIKQIESVPENSAQWVTTISTAQKLVTEIKTTETQIKQLKTDIESEIKDTKDLTQNIRSDVDKKARELKGKFKFPDISAESISKEFFGNLFQTRFHLIQHWVTQLRKNSEDAVTERIGEKTTNIIKRNLKSDNKDQFEQAYKAKLKEEIAKQGETIHFGDRERPKLWVKKLVIGGKSKKNQDLQNFKGHVLNISDNQKTIKKPIEVALTGDLPKHNINNVKINVLLNHHLKQMGEKFDITADYPISSFKIFDDSSFKLFLEKAAVAGNINGSIQDMKLLDFKILNQFANSKFFFESSKGDIQKILQPIFANLPDFNVDVLFNGNFLDPDMLINSSLGKKISSQLEAQFSAEIAKAQAKFNTLVAENLNQLQTKYLGKYATDLNDLNKDASSMEGLLKNKVDSLQAKLKSKKQEEINKAKDKLFKKLKGL